ncbi:MAG: translocation/assembly module TamB, partial [Proteobacteria bacterium]|nr:translocation/assembly module TamB [Pseudomonadota bacterium]
EAKADGKQVQIIAAQLKQANDRLRFSGKYSLARKAIESLEGELAISELGRYGAACKDLVGDLSGSLHGSVTQAPDNRQHISLKLRNAHLGTLPVSRGDLALDTQDWKNFSCTEAGIETSQGSISLSGLFVSDFSRQSITAKLQELAFFRGGTRFVAEKPFIVTAAYGGNKSLAIDSLVLRSPVGTVSASGKLSRQEEASFQLKASGFKSGEWLKGLLAEGYDFKGLELNLAIQGPLNRARGSLVGSVAALGSSHFAEPFAGVIDVAYSPEGLRLKKFIVNNAVGQQISLFGLIPYDPFAEKSILAGEFSLNGLIKLPDLAGVAAGLPRQGTVSGELVGEMSLSGSWMQPVGKAKLRAKNLTVPQLREVLPPEPLNLDCVLVLEGTRLQLTRCKVESASSSGTLSGEWRQLPSLASLVSQLPAELPGILAGQGNLKMADIGWLVQDSKAVRRLSGRLATNFSVSGRAAAPRFSGGLTLTDAALRFAKTTLPTMDGVTVRADFIGDTIHVQSMEGLLGGAPFNGDGTIVMAGDETRFDFAAKGKNLLFFRDADLKIRGDADLRLSGPVRKLVLSGKLIVTDGRYTKNIDFLRLFKSTSRPRSDIGLQVFSLPDPPFRDMEFGIEVSAAQPFLIRNNLAKGAVRPEFSLVGTGEVPVLVGRIFVDPVSISLPAGRLVIESGIITFPKNDPDRPTFDVTAKSKLAGYDIDMHLQGTADEPVITLSSQPALPDSDLLLLVLTGRPPLNGAGSGRRQVAGMNMAVYLGKGLLANWFGNGGAETDESVLERFELDIGREITSSGEDTVETRFRLVEGLLLPGDRLFITSERDVYDNYNVGVKIVFRFK